MLQLHLDGNKVDGPASAALAHMLCSLPRIEQLSLVGTDASLASLGALPPASLRQLREVDLRKLTLAPELMALLHAAGPAFAKLKLSAGEMAGRSDFLATLFARTAEHPALYIEFSGTVQAGGLGGGFVATSSMPVGPVRSLVLPHAIGNVAWHGRQASAKLGPR